MIPAEIKPAHLYHGTDGRNRIVKFITDGIVSYRMGVNPKMQKMPLEEFAGLAKEDVTVGPDMSVAPVKGRM